MIYNPKNKLDRESARLRFSFLIDGDSPFELTKKNPKRTIQQNKYLHLILGWYGMYFGYTLEESKIDFKKLNKKSFYYQKKGSEYIRSSAGLDTKELTHCIEKFRNRCAIEGFYIPEPNEYEKLQYIDQQINNSKFL